MLNIGSISKPSVEGRQNKLAASAVDKTDEIKAVDEKNQNKQNKQKQSRNKTESESQTEQALSQEKELSEKESTSAEKNAEEFDELVYTKKGKPAKSRKIDLKA